MSYCDDYYVEKTENVSSDASNNVIAGDVENSEIDISKKQELKLQAKKLCKTKLRLGQHYYLRSKAVEGSKQLIKEFKLIKLVYTINDTITNVAIMKQVSGVNNSIFTLSKYDCKKLHIKFEPGLQVFDINMNWIKKNEKYA